MYCEIISKEHNLITKPWFDVEYIMKVGITTKIFYYQTKDIDLWIYYTSETKFELSSSYPGFAQVDNKNNLD